MITGKLKILSLYNCFNESNTPKEHALTKHFYVKVVVVVGRGGMWRRWWMGGGGFPGPLGAKSPKRKVVLHDMPVNVVAVDAATKVWFRFLTPLLIFMRV